MAGNWTPEQHEAITQRGCNLLVAAAAGAGKTAVLVERIIRKITDSESPVDIDRLLVVTFTNAAATEMRERIGNALVNALEADPASENLQKQMTLLDRASIMTLHSFCLEVVKSHFHTLDLDPAFRIADETESTLLKMDALEELFESKYENQETGSEFFQLVESYGGGRDDSALRDIVLSLHRFTRSHPWPAQWLAAQAEAFNLGASACLSSTPWARELLKGAAAELQGLRALLGKAAALASRAQGLEPYCGVLAGDLQKLEELQSLCEAAAGSAAKNGSSAAASAAIKSAASEVAATSAAACGWDAIYSAFASYEPARLPRCGKDADLNVQDEVKAVRTLVKDKVRKLCDSGFNVPSHELLEDFRRLYPLFKYLSSMVCEFDDLYSAKKAAKGLLDFNDLEHYCLRVLLEENQPTPAALELRSRYEEILVDEYQDSNLIQELILGTVSGNQDGRFNIFMVGDVKQSIYRFRQAKPELFLSKYMTYPHESGHDSRVIQLYRNFRSRPGVINGVNFIFRQIMTQMVGELDYTDDEALNPGAIFDEAEPGCNTGGPIELHVIDVTSSAVDPMAEPDNIDRHSGLSDGQPIDGQNSTENDNADGPGNEGNTGIDAAEEESLDNIQAEARITGKRIRELVSHPSKCLQVFDKKLGKYRRVQYRDIVILMRATRNWADIFVDELAAMGIPAYADTGMGYFRTVEVETMLSLLQIIDNPLQDIPLLAVLRSPIGGFSIDELADIRLADRSVLFYEAMKLFAGSEPDPSDVTGSLDDTRRKTADFLQKLKNWRDISQFTTVDELVWKLMTDTGYYSYAGILPGGSERQANLRMLFERARQYEETSYKGLFNFINFIGKLKSGGGDMGSARVLGENDNVVRIMSIHKSKGLEFPVVIVSGCGKKFNMMDLNAGILLHQELGYGPDVVDLDRRTVIPSITKFAIRQKLKLETLSEEMRILYVAFTRAKEKLIITGCLRNITKAAAKWCSAADSKDLKLPVYDMQQAGTYLDWLGPALARHDSAGVLRTASVSGSSSIILNDDSCWEIKLWGMGAAAVEKEAAEAGENMRQWLEAISPANDAAEASEKSGYSVEELIRRLEWEYPYRPLSIMPAKLTVTELKRRFAAEENQDAASPFRPPMVARPAFMEPEKGLDAARKGSVMHFVMQHLELVKLAEIYRNNGMAVSDAVYSELRSQLSSMEANEQLTAAEAETVNIPAICAFFNTSVGIRMLTVPYVKRETAFNIEIKCSEIYKELPQELYGNETMLLQGVIDCWFETEDGIVLLDYKTDYVQASGADMIRERYRVQIEYYTRALEVITGKKVAERYLYLFHSGELVSC